MGDVLGGTLVVGPSWVGDMVLAQSLFKQLKLLSPETPIDVLAPAWAIPLTQRMAEIRRGITMPLGHGELALGVRYRLGRSLRANEYRRAIVLPNSLKAALIPFWANVSVRTGFRGEWRYGLLNDVRVLNKTALPTTVSRFVSLGMAREQSLPDVMPTPCLRVDAVNLQSVLARLEISTPTKPLLILCPGAEYGPAKRWPPEYFGAVARAQSKRGWEIWLLGSAKDAVITSQVARSAGVPCVDLAGKTQLEDVVDLMSLASAIVSNDSGLMHIAAALARPLIAVYGSSDPKFTPPMSASAHIERLDLSCSPCFKRECPFGHYNCLIGIQPERVIAAIDTLGKAA